MQKTVIFLYLPFNLQDLQRGCSINTHATQVLYCWNFGSLECHQVGLPLFEDEGLWPHGHKLSATHAKKIHYEPDCQTQKGSTPGHVFLTFKHQFQRN